MKIVSASGRVEHFRLTRPYAIAFRETNAVENAVVTIRTSSGVLGVGAGSPEPHVTGETITACRAAVEGGALDWLVGRDVREVRGLCRELARRVPAAPAARAAVDIALHDLAARHLGVPLVDLLGRVHDRLPTAITIGIKPVEETLVEAEEYLARGFRILKVKVGRSLSEDIERLARLRERLGEDVRIRVDANQGYSRENTLRFVEETARWDLELIEQPMAAREVEAMRSLPESVRERVAADESLLDERDALALSAPPRACGIFNVKLMKCGGIRPALRIAAIAETARIALMWGCMDESAISIAAALHAAFASPATRYLDLDGSLDLARDVVTGGFHLKDGMMNTMEAPGLGVTLKVTGER